MVSIFNYDEAFPPLSTNYHPLTSRQIKAKPKPIMDFALITSLCYILIKDKQLGEDKIYLINALTIALKLYFKYFNDNLENRMSLEKLINAIDNHEISDQISDEEYKQLKAIHAYWLYEAKLVNIN